MELTFDKTTHTYKLGSKELISVTQLMQKHGLAPDYSLVPADILRAKAERGTIIHEEIEALIKNHENGFTKETGQFAAYLLNKGVYVSQCQSETMVHNDIVAGTIDLIYDCPKETEGTEKVIADFKTTASLHRDSVAWQLSIYNALNGYQADRAEAFHFQGDGSLKVVPVNLIPKEEVEALFECERNGEIYQRKTNGIISSHDLALIEEAERIIAESKRLKEYAEKQIATINEAIISTMKAMGLTKFENENLCLTYIAPYMKQTFDSTKFKADHPDMVDEYMKTSQVGESLRIKLKDKE